MTSQTPISLLSLFCGFARDTSGAMAVWAVAATPVLLGGAALSVDISRLYNMDQNLQSAADALARAGAAELDQSSDSLARSNRAIHNLVANSQKFGSDGKSAVRVKSIRFLSYLPDQDYDDVSADMVTTNPSIAKYVEVDVVPETVNTVFPQGLVRTISSVDMGADSIAGFSQDICGAAPIFICNPFEGNTQTSIHEAMDDPDFQRRQFKFIGTNGSSRYSPGNFGYLDPFANNSGASKIADAIAIDVPPVCLSKSAGVHLRPGRINSIDQALNVRFDMYEGSFKSKKSDPSYAPAQNVVKGYTPKNNDVCSLEQNSSAQGLPRDSIFETSQQGNGNNSSPQQMGSGDWDFVEYMRVNHNYMRSIRIEGITYWLNYYRGVSYPSTPPSRYAMYRWEIENNCVPGALTYGQYSQTPEEGLPLCHASGGHSDPTLDRRILKLAILNCGEIQDTGENMQGRTGPLPVEAFAEVFVTEPMEGGSDSTIYGEIVGPVGQGNDDAAQDMIAISR